MAQLDSTWSKGHPFRAPDWRWLRANTLYQSDEIPRCKDNDEYVVELIYFLRKWRNDKPAPNEQIYAVEIYTLEELSLIRWEIEARILVDQSPNDIADLVGIDPSSVTWFERWFYDVRDKLKNKSYIYQWLIAPKIDKNHDYISQEVVWKTYAMFGDVDILNQVIFDCHTSIDKEQFWMDDLVQTALRRLATTSRFGKLAPKNVLSELSRLYVALTKNKQPTTGASAPDFTEIIKPILSSVKWDWSESNPPDQVVMVGNASLTSQELLQLRGRPPGPKYTEFLETAKFPE